MIREMIISGSLGNDRRSGRTQVLIPGSAHGNIADTKTDSKFHAHNSISFLL